MHDQNVSINIESLVDLSARLNNTVNEEFIFNSALLSLMGKLRFFRACVLLPDDEDKYKIVYSKGKTSLDYISQFDIDSPRYLSEDSESESSLLGSSYEFCIPIKYLDRLLAVICLGKRMINKEISPSESQYAYLVSSLTAISIQNARNYKSLVYTKNDLEVQNHLLTTLFEIGKSFSSLLSRNEILKQLSYHLMGHLMVSRFAVIVKNGNNRGEVLLSRFKKDISCDCIDSMLEQETIVLKEHLDENSQLRLEMENINAELISPMVVQGDVRGIVLVGKKLQESDFNEVDLMFVQSLSGTAMISLENERLFREEVKKKKLESEMDLALEIQKNLLPKVVPELAGIDLYGMSRPSRHVGGDYFDYIKLSDSRILIAIADVSGKGMPASLLMANVQATLRVLSPLNLPLIEMVRRINGVIYNNTTADKFVTFFCGILDSESNTFEYINAGHNPPFLFHLDGELELLTKGGIILGIDDFEYPYEIGNVDLNSGDLIYLFTDGVSEAMDSDHNEYGEDRLEAIVRDNLNENSVNISQIILDDVSLFTDGNAQYDDITMVIMKIKNPD
jgi:sigma-B regulation protein RsbU (phosphoserine phosphatase)